MRISNPPPIQQESIEVSDIDVPAGFTTTANQSISNGSNYTVSADADRRELILTNASASADLWYRDSTATTVETGTLLAPRATHFLSTRGAVRVTNNSGGAVTLAINSIHVV